MLTEPTRCSKELDKHHQPAPSNVNWRMTYLLQWIGHAVRRIFSTGRLSQVKRYDVKQYDAKLWGGFSTSALVDLTSIKMRNDVSVRDRVNACYRLARWYATQGDFSAALQQMVDARKMRPRVRKRIRHAMLESLFLCQLGRAAEARVLLERCRKGWRFNPSLQLMLANTVNPAAGVPNAPQSEAYVLAHINAIYRFYGVSELQKRDPTKPLSLDNLQGVGSKKYFDPNNKISVLLPVCNAADHILTALRGLSEQSWENIEVIVVDDASTDATVDIVSEFIKNDERFILIRQPENLGAYTARNVGLSKATGRFVTVHDSDDWSHPDKLLSQIQALLESGEPYNISTMARATSELIFLSATFRPSPKLVTLNHSSGLFYREEVKKLGGWDAVRVAGDTTFYWKYEKRLGNKLKRFNKRRILKGCPLSFVRATQSSLTRASVTHVQTTLHGVRREYRESFTYWINRDVSLPPVRDDYSKVNVPSLIRAKKESHVELDALFIGDFNIFDDAYHWAVNMIRAARRDGLRVGLLHYRRYDLNVAEPLADRVRDLAYEESFRIVAPGESVITDRVIVTCPAIFQHKMDRFPQVDFKRLIVVVNQIAEQDMRNNVAYASETIRENLRHFFGSEGDWVPVSEMM